MNLFPRFSIGFRFSLAQQPRLSASDCWRILLSRIPASIVVGASLHACLDDRRQLPEDAYICAMGDLSLASGKLLCAHCIHDAVLHSYLTQYRPIIQNNEMLSLGRENYTDIGVVATDGSVAGCAAETVGLRFCAEYAVAHAAKRGRILLVSEPCRQPQTKPDVGRAFLRSLGGQEKFGRIDRFFLPLSGVGLTDALIMAYNGRYASTTLPNSGRHLVYGVLPNRTALLDGVGVDAEALAAMREAVCLQGYRNVAVTTTDATDPLCQALLALLQQQSSGCQTVVVATEAGAQHTPHVCALMEACREASLHAVLAMRHENAAFDLYNVTSGDTHAFDNPKDAALYIANGNVGRRNPS